MPLSIASIREKSLTVHGNKVPSAYPEPRRKKGVAERSMTCLTPRTRLTASRAIYPDAGLFIILLRFCSLFGTQGTFLGLVNRLLPVAVMTLIVQYEDVLHTHEGLHDTIHHLPFGL